MKYTSGAEWNWFRANYLGAKWGSFWRGKNKADWGDLFGTQMELFCGVKSAIRWKQSGIIFWDFFGIRVKFFCEQMNFHREQREMFSKQRELKVGKQKKFRFFVCVTPRWLVIAKRKFWTNLCIVRCSLNWFNRKPVGVAKKRRWVDTTTVAHNVYHSICVKTTCPLDHQVNCKWTTNNQIYGNRVNPQR